MIGLGVWLYFAGKGLQSNLLLVAGFLFLIARREKKLAVYAYMNFLTAKQSELGKAGALGVNYLIAFDETPVADVLRLFAPRRYHFILVINRRHEVIGRISEKKLLDAAFRGGLNLTLHKIRLNSRLP